MATRVALLLSILLLSAVAAYSSSYSSEQQQKLQHCQQKCQQQHSQGSDLKLCSQWCEEQYKQGRGDVNQGKGQQQQGSESENNPYFFDKQSFTQWVRTEHGNIKALQRFTDKSYLLRGIDNYRLAVIQANPQTFIVPHHSDSDGVIYVVSGAGSITILHEDDRETHDIRRGDIYRIPSGATVYLVNSDRNEELSIAKIYKTISVPGEFKEFFGAGGENPESFYSSFSSDILEAAFNTPKEDVWKMLGQQKQGAILRASEQQIRALSKKSSISEATKTVWPFGGKSSKPYNLLKQQPAHANSHGQVHEATQKDYEALSEIDVDVSIANISSGSMMAPNYNTKATKLVLVLEGQGHAEIICPHVSDQQRSSEKRQEGGVQEIHYQNVRSNISPGSLFVVPAGHPVSTVSSGDQNLVLLCFGVNARDNQKQFLAGKNNVLKQLTDEAMELSFDTDAQQVKRVLDAQDQSVFLPGPEERQSWKRGMEMAGNVLEFAGV